MGRYCNSGHRLGDNRMGETFVNEMPIPESPQEPVFEDLEFFKAKREAEFRSKALTLSSNCVYLLLVCHIGFAYFGKVLPIPEIVWAIVLAPWLGAAAGKGSSVLEDLLAKGKK